MVDRFWPKVAVAGPNDCWPWQRATNDGGYGVFRIPGTNRNILAHRFALEGKLGRPIAPGLQSLHTCDNPPCCNPAHLFEGTVGMNMDDMARKGHTRKKMTVEIVRELRLDAASGMSYPALASKYSMSLFAVWAAATGQTWKHVDAPVIEINRKEKVA